jgi:hypothetical protein
MGASRARNVLPAAGKGVHAIRWIVPLAAGGLVVALLDSLGWALHQRTSVSLPWFVSHWLQEALFFGIASVPLAVLVSRRPKLASGPVLAAVGATPVVFSVVTFLQPSRWASVSQVEQVIWGAVHTFLLLLSAWLAAGIAVRIVRKAEGTK